MTIKIVTDSTSDLDAVQIHNLGIILLPVYINIGEQSYLDGVDMTRAEFYQKLPTFHPHPKTASPSIETFQSIYEKLASDGATGIISIHIAESLSNTINAARVASEKVKSVPIQIVDSGNLTLGTGFQAVAAAEMANQGKGIEEIVGKVKDIASRMISFALLDTLEYMRRGGRLTRAQYELGRILNIKPILVMRCGVMKLERTFTFRNSIKRVIETIHDSFLPIEKLGIVHSNALNRVEEFRGRIAEFLPSGMIPQIAEVTPAIGAHVGPGGLGVVCLSVNNQERG